MVGFRPLKFDISVEKPAIRSNPPKPRPWAQRSVRLVGGTDGMRAAAHGLPSEGFRPDRIMAAPNRSPAARLGARTQKLKSAARFPEKRDAARRKQNGADFLRRGKREIKTGVQA